MATPSQIVLLPNNLHCVKTAIALPDSIDAINAALTDGRLEAGCAVGHVKLSSDMRAKYCANGAKLPNYRWSSRGKDGNWRNYEGHAIGEHNCAVLESRGVRADPKTLTIGTKGNRQYGDFPEPTRKPKVAPSVLPSFDAVMTGTVPTPAPIAAPALVLQEAVTLPATVNALDVIPTAFELGGGAKGGASGWAAFRSRACKSGLTSADAGVIWKAAKNGVSPAPAVVMAAQPAIVEAPVQPAPAQSGTVVQCSPDTLQALLASVGTAIVEFDAAKGMFSVTM
jgi:hypothetical protein